MIARENAVRKVRTFCPCSQFVWDVALFGWLLKTDEHMGKPYMEYRVSREVVGMRPPCAPEGARSEREGAPHDAALHTHVLRVDDVTR